MARVKALGKFAENDRVEVLSSEDGFSDAWATATVIGPCKGGWQVEYSKFVDGDGKQLREKVHTSCACLCIARAMPTEAA
jgi:hypothetical protein